MTTYITNDINAVFVNKEGLKSKGLKTYNTDTDLYVEVYAYSKYYYAVVRNVKSEMLDEIDTSKKKELEAFTKKHGLVLEWL